MNNIQKIINPLKNVFLLSFLLLIFIFNTSIAFADFYVIAGSRGVGTQIKSLPYTISSPGFYYIAKDLSCSAESADHGITIEADNVTLDLMGFSLIGPGGTASYDGIYMYSRANIEIRNGTVRNFPRNGIKEEDPVGGTGHRIINIRAKDNGNYGIFLYSRSNIVERCTAQGNYLDGIYAYVGSTVINNTCFDNADEGIFVSSGSTVTNNTCYDNGDKGIEASSGSTVTNNTCYSNSNNGIYASMGATVINNTCYSNSNNGITVGLGSTVTTNTCYDNNNNGIFVGESSTVTGNTCRSNTNYGIYLSGKNLVDQNTSTDNGAGKNMSSCATCKITDANYAP